jgi:hypothetical protein
MNHLLIQVPAKVIDAFLQRRETMEDVWAVTDALKVRLDLMTETAYANRYPPRTPSGAVPSDGHVVQDIHGEGTPPPQPNDQEEYDAWPNVYPGQ